MLFDNSKLFRDIAHARSVSKGAAHNGISQSAASQHIHELEKKLGMPLLDRTTRPLTLTTAGKLYFDLCRDVLRREEEFQTALDALKARVEGEVRVVSIYSIGLSEMSRLQDEFSLRSHRLAAAATDSGAFAKEIAPTWGRDEEGRRKTIIEDQGIRRDTSLEALSALRPATPK